MDVLLLTAVITLLAGNTMSQELCAENLCTNGENCYNRPIDAVSPNGYVCECNQPFRDGYNCAIGPDNQEVYTCFGSDCMTGTFTSLDWPNNYPNRYRALYLLYIPGANGIKFTFNAPFNIELNKDELYIGKGLTLNFNQLLGVNTVGPDLVFFEGENLPSETIIQNTDVAFLYFISDKNLNFQGFSVNFQMVDNEAPVVSNCPPNQALTTSVPEGIQAVWAVPTATDASVFTTTTSHMPGQLFPQGNTLVSYLFVDRFGNDAVCSFSISVTLVDNEQPQIQTTSQNITVTVPFGASGTTVTWTEPTATDNLGTVFTSRSRDPGSFFATGTATEIVYSFADAAGNTARTMFTVTIVEEGDDLPPVITSFPPDRTVTVPFGTSSVAVTWVEPTSTDNSGTSFQNSNIQSGSTFQVGNTPVTYTIVDQRGNSIQQTFVVTVIMLPDDEPPVIQTFPNDITITIPFGTDSSVVNWQVPTVTDNSGTASISSNRDSGSTFPVGLTPVVFTFTDPTGNSVMRTLNINILVQSDDEPPTVISFPSDITVTVPFGTAGTVVTWNEPISTDNSGTSSYTTSTPSGSPFPRGNTVVVYTFTDPNRNTVTRSFNVNVIELADAENPVIQTFPADITVNVPFGIDSSIVNWPVPTATDNSGSVNIITNRQPGSTFQAGLTPVVYTFTDPNGNSVMRTFNVNVVPMSDTQPPTIDTFPLNIIRTVPFGTTDLIVTWDEPTSTDNSGNSFQNPSRPSGSSFPLGNTLVVYTFTDPSGNFVQRTFTVNVLELADTEPPTILTFPNDIAVTVPFGTDSSVVNWPVPTSTDNSGTVTITTSSEPGTTFPTGTTTVTYTFSDNGGNSVMRSFEVNVMPLTDRTPPVVITFPPDITVTVPFGTSETIVTWNEPTSTDNSGTSSQTTPIPSGSTFSLGNTPVIYTFTDQSGNNIRRTLNVNVIQLGDDERPVIQTFPDDISVTIPFGSTEAVVNWPVPTATDNSGTVSITTNREPGTVFQPGLTAVTYMFTDPSGNIVTRTFNVNVMAASDNQPPVIISFPADITVNLPFGTMETIVTWDEPISVDNSGTTSQNPTRPSGSVFPLGTTTVSYTITDPTGNLVIRTFDVNVNQLSDNEAPSIITFPTDITVTVPFGVTSTPVNWAPPVSTDNSGTVNVVTTKEPGSSFPAGRITEVTYTFTDASGNSVNRMFDVNIMVLADSVPPVVTRFPADVTVTVPFGTQSTLVNWEEPTSTDNSGSSSQTASIPSGSNFQIGTTEVTYTFTDPNGNLIRRSFNVRVVELPDNIRPTITSFPSDVTINVPFGTTSAIATWTEPTSMDNSGTSTQSASTPSGSSFPLGITPVTYTFTDPSGNARTRTFSVNVVMQSDNERPTIETFPNDITVTVPFGTSSTLVNWNTPTSTDNSGTVSTNSNIAPGSMFTQGTTSVMYTFTDPSGNLIQRSFNVNVVVLPDGVPPVITSFPADMTITVPFGTRATVVTWNEPQSMDNSGFSFQNPNKTSGSTFPLGTTPVTYNFMDRTGNGIEMTFYVNVIELPDTDVPLITSFPNDITRTVLFGTLSTPVTWQEPTYIDNSGTAVVTSDIPSGTSFLPGTTPVTYTITDPSGNNIQRSFNVIVVVLPDQEPPIILTFPTDVTVTVPFGTQSIPVTWDEPTSTDNSGASFQNPSIPSGSAFPIGTTPVIYEFNDPTRNVVRRTFQVTVIMLNDNEPPTVDTFPNDITVTVPFGTSSTVVNWPFPTATDNSGTVNTFTDNEPGSSFRPGSNTVTYTFTDPAGNIVIRSFDVNILVQADGVPPEITTFPNDITVSVPFGTTGSVVTWNEPTSTDNSGSTIQTASRVSGSTFPIGSTPVKYTFTDQTGNVVERTFMVAVVELSDGEPPMITSFPSDITVTVPFGTQSIPVNWLPPTVRDNSGIIETNANKAPGDLFSPGSTSVAYTFTDPNGNIVIRSFNVIVNVLPDSEVPTILTFPSDMTVTVPFGTSSTVVTWDEPTSSDNSGGTFQTPSKPSGSQFDVGITPVTYTITDAAGNNVIRTFSVNVVMLSDTNAPTVTSFPSDVTITVPFGTNSIPVNWNEPTSMDNSGSSVPSVNIPSGSSFPIESTSVEYTFMDPNGNFIIRTFMVNIIMLPDNEEPMIQQFPTDITITVPFGTTDTSVNWPIPEVTDNSGVVNVVANREPGSRFQPGINTVTYTFTDPAGNNIRRSFNVNIVVDSDDTPPVINTFPSDITVMVPFGSTGTRVTWDEPTSTDNSGTTIPSSNIASGSTFPVGTTRVSYTITDPSGNTRIQTFNVNVIMMPDTEYPVVQEFPEDITVTIPFGSDSTPVTWPQPQVTDNSGTVNSITNKQPGTSFPDGVTTVMYTFTDPSGNIVTREFDVTVMVLPDNEPPVVTRFPSDLTITVPFGMENTVVNWDEPTSTDNSGFPFQTPSRPSGSTFPIGITPVRYTFTDPSGNNYERTFTINVVQLPDRISPSIVSSPENIEVFVPFGSTGTNVNWSPPTATDNSGRVIPSTSREPGSFFPLGTTPVTYQFTDPTGNEVGTTFTVKVTELPDVIPPMITSVPDDVTVTIPFGSSGTTVSWPEPTATDNSGSYSTTKTHEPGSFFPPGSVTPITYTFTDTAGNPVSTTFIVRVVEQTDRQSPMLITCQTDITFHIMTGKAPVPIYFTMPTAQDNSGTVNLVAHNKNPGDLFNAGRTTVEYRFQDQAGNYASCVFDVDVVEANPCSLEPCQNGAACVPTTLTTYTCVCPDCFNGETCENAVDACQANGCQNGAACAALSGSCSQYECQCPTCYIGQFCQTYVDSCENHQCANGAQCVGRPDSCVEYTCRCPPCLTGRYCDIPVSACDNHACQTGGLCMPFSLTTNSLYSCSQYRCSCTGCYTGARCEIQRDTCNPSPCLNGGACSSLPDSCYSYTCRCSGCFTGFNCEIPIQSPCINNPCQNGGVCSEIQGLCGAYTCTCPNNFIGLDCETLVSENPNPCNSFPCKNGASCLTMDADHYMCLCTGEYVGPNCRTERVNAPQMDSCGSFPCINGAFCFNSFNSNSGSNTFIPQYSCICANGFTGTNCDTLTGDEPALDICFLGERPLCLQEAQCSNAFHSLNSDVDYFCACPVGYVGHNCETTITNPCLSNPCKNGARCAAFNTFFMCECLPGFGAKTCESRVGDTTPPSISNCPASIYTGDGSQDSQTVTWIPPTATDESSVVTLVYVSHQPNTLFPRGVVPVTYIFADAGQNYARCIFYVNIGDNVQITDNIPPTLANCPTNIILTVPIGAISGVATWSNPDVTDNSVGPVNLRATATSGDSFNIGETTVTFTATDAFNNEARCSFTVTVFATSDNIPPVISNCPMGASATAQLGATSTEVIWSAPSAVDNSGGQVTVQLSHQPGQSFPLGITDVTYTFYDSSGNEAICSFVVMVNSANVPSGNDPVISGCPSEQSVDLDQGSEFATVTWVEPTAVHISGRELGVAKSHQPPATFDKDTITRVSYVFYDISGTYSTCVFTVRVSSESVVTTDNIDPVFTNCPDNIIAYVTGPGATASIGWSVPTATDNSGIEPTVTSSLAPPANLSIGTTRALYTATDAAGNEATCSFNVTIILDEEAPTFTGCPNNIDMVLPEDNQLVSVTWEEPIGTDNSGSITVARSSIPGDFFPLGSSLVDYIFTDVAGNDAICSFTVTISSGDISSNPCSSNPCPSNQDCYYRPDPSEFLCLTSRAKRDVNQDDCMCMNGGVCVSVDNSFYCTCPNNFTGVLCEKKTVVLDSTKLFMPHDLEPHHPHESSFEMWIMGAMMTLLAIVVIVLAITVNRLVPRKAIRTDTINKAHLVY